MDIAITCKHMQRDRDQYLGDLAGHGLTVHFPPVPGQELAGAALVDAMQGMVGVIAGDDVFDASVLEQLPALRTIAKWGIGLDGIDRVAADAAGISVTNTPGMFNDEVAEMAIGYLIASIRGIVRTDRAVRAGGWPNPVGRSLSALRVTVVGLGNIGHAFAAKALGLGLAVTAVDPADSAAIAAAELGIRLEELPAALRQTDVLVVTCPLNDSTRGLIDDSAIELLPQGAHVVNVGRGPVVREEAIVRGLQSGHLGGAALDVFETEPISNTSRLLEFDNCIVGSHNSSNTAEACTRTHYAAIDNLLQGLGIT